MSTHKYIVSENIPFCTKTPLILLISAGFCKKIVFLAKIVPIMRAVLEIFQLFLGFFLWYIYFLLEKRLVLMKMKVLETIYLEFGFWIT